MTTATKDEAIKKKLTNAMNNLIVGLKVHKVGYDQNNFPVIWLEDGSAIWIQSDDECNGPGVPVHVRNDPKKPTGQIETGMWQIWSDE